jgi:hypothetical protein
LCTRERARIIPCLVEGNSIRAICRMTGAAKNTVVKVLVDLGRACSAFQDETLRALPCKKVQCDEVWAFVYSKQKNVPEEHYGEFGYGDVWTWTAICADCKLAVSWLVGERNEVDAMAFVKDVVDRLAHRVQLTTDGHKPYLMAVESVFGGDIDYAQLIKMYGETSESEKRYSPAECIGTEKRRINGDPNLAMCPPATLSGRTSQCAWACGASLG